MKKYFLLLNLLIVNFIFSQNIQDNIKFSSTVDKSNVSVGEKIFLTVKVNNIKNAKVLWEELRSSYDNLEIYSKLDYYKNRILLLDIVFAFFDPDKYDNLYFTIPIRTENGNIFYLKTSKININVKAPISKEEIEKIKNTSEPSKIELKKEKAQANIPFYFSFFIKIFLIIILIVIAALISYYYFYKYFIKSKFGNGYINLSPYEKFLVNIEKIKFDKDDDRLSIERTLSDLTEILKELVFDDFNLNAPSETTKELIYSLRKISLKPEMIKSIYMLFEEIDLVKFAKAPINFIKLERFLSSIKELGASIHEFKVSIDSNSIEENIKQTAGLNE